MRILVVSALLGPGLLTMAAACAWPPPETAAPAPAPAVTAATEPAAPGAIAAVPPPAATEVAYVPVPSLWLRMLALPAPAGRLMLNNFSFETTRIQAVLAAASPCAIAEGAVVTEFVLPPNGTRVLPAPPGWDICWRRQLIQGEAREIPPEGPWTVWNRAYTGPGRLLDVMVVTPEPLPAIAAPTGPLPALPPTFAPAFPMPALPPGQR